MYTEPQIDTNKFLFVERPQNVYKIIEDKGYLEMRAKNQN
jgi:hypothetical protein